MAITNEQVEIYPESSLLKLPPELQSHIFEDALDQPNGITISRSRWASLEAPLLSTCRYIRKECIKMYYALNYFQLIFEDYDSSVYPQFEKVLKRHGIAARGKISVSIDGRPNWDNLCQWLHCVHDGNLPVPTWHVSYGSADYRAIETLFYHAKELWHGETWTNLEFALRIFRVELGRYDYRWLPEGHTFDSAHRALVRETFKEMRRQEQSRLVTAPQSLE